MFKKLSFAILLTSTMIGSAFAGTLTTDLYRSGNATVARMENVRLDRDPPDVEVFKKNGVDWVRGKVGGISTFSTPPAVGQEKNWWKATKGTTYSDKIYLIQKGNHWGWAPAYDMPLADYIKLMSQANSYFTKIK